MRYKEITLKNIEKLGNMLNNIERENSRGDREEVEVWIEKMRDMLEITRSQIAIESDDLNVREI